MPSTFLGLNTGLSGLNYFQSALNTTSHNISNANTKGYSRQQILATASDPLRYHRTYGMMGTGVKGVSIDRQREVFYDNKYWQASSKCTQYETQYDSLSNLQMYMDEIGGESGYTKWISQISNALQDIADKPEDYTTRISYALVTDGFTDVINELSTNFQSEQKSLNDQIELVVNDINTLAKQIYELTKQIINVELKGGTANDLRDMRDVCIDRLSEYTTVEVNERSIMYGNGVEAVPASATTMSVYINGELLVDDMGYKELMVSPRREKINLNDVDGLVDIYWKCTDGTAGEEFYTARYNGKLTGLINVRDGNNGELFSGTITGAGGNPPSVKVELAKAIHVDKLNIPEQGTITLNGRDYLYDGWKADYDAEGNLNNFEFLNMTMINDNGVEVAAIFPNGIEGHIAKIGESNIVKGIPYYQARLNEFVRTLSKYMNDITTSGVDENGDEGLDMFTAVQATGGDYVLKNTMDGTGNIASSASSYYKLTAMNWELNSSWKTDPAKVVVSYERDVEQGNVAAKPIIDRIMYGMTDQTMFQQGSLSQYLQAMTTTLAVDIKKMEIFTANQDDIKYTIDTQRKSISGVDENEEASDLVKFENLYNLASKVISVLNEVYDKLINETGV
ncbi:MAG: flagellar hook-associated protein FlgK [Clostridium sp.]|nr:flagellar hook-associated protein FlgK [Clostridium sp.]MCM1207813.1 flagellar hook-associated protein FlgK [Ruminococcus sp.]